MPFKSRLPLIARVLHHAGNAYYDTLGHVNLYQTQYAPLRMQALCVLLWVSATFRTCATKAV